MQRPVLAKKEANAFTRALHHLLPSGALDLRRITLLHEGRERMLCERIQRG
jgi:hypothetical protein